MKKILLIIIFSIITFISVFVFNNAMYFFFEIYANEHFENERKIIIFNINVNNFNQINVHNIDILKKNFDSFIFLKKQFRQLRTHI